RACQWRVGSNRSRVPGDQACASLVREERICPLQQHTQPAAKAREIENVHEEPCPPGEVAAQVPPGDDGDRFVATDRRQVAFVTIAEAHRRLTAQQSSNVARRGASALYRCRSHGGYRYAV